MRISVITMSSEAHLASLPVTGVTHVTIDVLMLCDYNMATVEYKYIYGMMELPYQSSSHARRK